MSPEEFKSLRRLLGLSQNNMARAIGANDGSFIRKFENGSRNIPWGAASAITRLAEVADKYVIADGADTPSAYLIRLHPPAFIALIGDDDAGLQFIAWLDKPPPDETMAELMREAGEAYIGYLAKFDAENDV